MLENLKLFWNKFRSYWKIYFQYKKNVYRFLVLIFNITSFYVVFFRNDITSNYHVKAFFINPHIIDYLPMINDSLSLFIIITTLILDIFLILFDKINPVSMVMILYGIFTRFYYKLYNNIYNEEYIVFKNNFFKITKKLNKNDYLDIFNSIVENKFKNEKFKIELEELFNQILPELEGIDNYNFTVIKITAYLEASLKNINIEEVIPFPSYYGFGNELLIISLIVGSIIMVPIINYLIEGDIIDIIIKFITRCAGGKSVPVCILPDPIDPVLPPDQGIIANVSRVYGLNPEELRTAIREEISITESDVKILERSVEEVMPLIEINSNILWKSGEDLDFLTEQSLNSDRLIKQPKGTFLVKPGQTNLTGTSDLNRTSLSEVINWHLDEAPDDWSDDWSDEEPILKTPTQRSLE